MKAYLETDATEQLENAATPVRDKPLERLLARLDCPISEALALEVKGIDLLHGTVTIQHFNRASSLPVLNVALGRVRAMPFVPSVALERV